MRVFVSAPIRGERAPDPSVYATLVHTVEKTGHEIAAAHGAAADPEADEVGMTERQIFQRDFDDLTASDLVIAEVSTPSHGVGWEIAWMLTKGRMVIACCQRDALPRLSAMIRGNPSPWQQLIAYEDAADLERQLTDLLT